MTTAAGCCRRSPRIPSGPCGRVVGDGQLHLGGSELLRCASRSRRSPGRSTTAARGRPVVAHALDPAAPEVLEPPGEVSCPVEPPGRKSLAEKVTGLPSTGSAGEYVGAPDGWAGPRRWPTVAAPRGRRVDLVGGPAGPDDRRCSGRARWRAGRPVADEVVRAVVLPDQPRDLVDAVPVDVGQPQGLAGVADQVGALGRTSCRTAARSCRSRRSGRRRRWSGPPAASGCRRGPGMRVRRGGRRDRWRVEAAVAVARVVIAVLLPRGT